jgi:hypothetical protein
MELLFKNREIADQEFITLICNDILSKKLEDKPFSQDYCAIFVDGRPRKIKFLEDLACLTSFKVFSKFNYPILMFINGDIGFEDSDLQKIGIKNKEELIKKYRIEVIKIPELNSHDLYSKFCIEQLPFLIPNEFENLLFLTPDGFLINQYVDGKCWETYLEEIRTDYIGSAWGHKPNIQIKYNNIWMEFTEPVQVGNNGFAFQKRSMMQFISQTYRDKELREMGTKDKYPPSDLLYSVFTNMYGRLATVEQANHFSIDPLHYEDYQKIKNNQASFYGFHFPKFNK